MMGDDLMAMAEMARVMQRFVDALQQAVEALSRFFEQYELPVAQGAPQVTDAYRPRVHRPQPKPQRVRGRQIARQQVHHWTWSPLYGRR